MQIPEDKLHAAKFYCLPKIHKWTAGAREGPGRPIASTIGTHSEAASKYLDKKLRLVLEKISGTVCSSSQDLVLQIDKINEAIRLGQQPPLSNESILFCADVSALYPSIPINYGLERVKMVCEQTGVFSPQELAFLLALLHWVLSTYVVEFNGKKYLQISGTAMGTPVAVIYSIIVMCSMEENLVEGMRLYTRFIDDLFAICTEEQARKFVASFQKICEKIQLDPKSITMMDKGVMLDLQLFISEGKIGHSIYQKPLNIYQYITPSSAHAWHVFPALVLNELKRYRLMCTEDADYNAQVSRFYERLINRGYSDEMIHDARVLVPSRDELMEVLKARREEKLNRSSELQQAKKTRPVVASCLPVFSEHFNLASFVHLPPELTSNELYKAKFAEGPVLHAHKNLKSVRGYLSKSSKTSR
jgi:hypothetical protein